MGADLEGKYPENKDDISAASLGDTIRANRKARGMTLRELAQQSGISIGMLSQIEQGKSMPSIRSLRLIGVALHLPVSSLFGEDAATDAEDKYVVRRFKRQTLKLNDNVLKELMSPPSLQSLEIFNVVLQSSSMSSIEAYSHSGEKAVIVLEGRLSLWLKEQRLELAEGDTCQFSGEIPHRYANNGSNQCRMIWILTPPST